MRRHSLFSRWISRDRAERYVSMFGGKVFIDRLNGYTLLIDVFRKPIAFIKK